MRCILATNSVADNSTVEKLKQVLKTVTDAALFIEQILAASGLAAFDPAGVERITAAFGNLAAIAIQAAHDVADKEITPDSVLALLPVSTPLAPPTKG